MQPRGEEHYIDEAKGDLISIDGRKDLLSCASTYLDDGNYKASEGIYRGLLSANPNDEDALFGFGLLAQKTKQFDAAIKIFSYITALNANHRDAFFQRGRSLLLQGKFDNSIEDFSVAIKLCPDCFETRCSRGLAFARINDFQNALIDYSEAIALKPNSANAFYNRALAYKNLGHFEEAIGDYSEAIRIDSKHFQALNNRGMALRDMGRFKEAIVDFDRCIAVNPEFAECYWNKALTHLITGDYSVGWRLYEYRWKTKNFTSKMRNFEEPLWLGKEPLSGKTILLHSEQGLGDTIQFCRYIKKFNQKDCTVLLEVEKPLMRLMGQLLPKEQIFEKETTLPPFDYHCPLMSLPLAFKTTIETIPCQKPYLRAEKADVGHWKNKLKNNSKKWIGICWKGNPNNLNDQRRSMELDSIIGSLSSEYNWCSLQLNVSNHEQSVINENKNITHFGSRIGDFASTAALCRALDAVISVDTSIAHLAGAIGCPTYLLLSHIADSRWHADASSTPWYPSMRIIRKSMETSWGKKIIEAQQKIEF